MNALVPVQYHAQLPAFLRKPEFFADTDKAVAGIGGGLPAHVSIKSSKLRLIDGAGQESLVNQLHLDVIVLTGNEHLSKVYYAGAFDPADVSPPDCWSDNGVGPSAQSASPQHAICAGCPQNAFGSRVNTATGSNMKACADRKKLAVVLGADTPVMVNGVAGVAKAYAQVYLLNLPTMSMRPWASYAKDIKNRGVPMIGVVTRLTFDVDANYPALLYQAIGFVPSEDILDALVKLRDAPATAEAVGSNDRPLGATTAAPPAPALSASAGAVAAAQPLTPPAAAPSPPAASSAPAASATSGTPRRRGRPPDAPPVAATGMPGAQAQTGGGLFPGNGAVIQPAAAASADLDALLAQALK